MRGRPPKHPDLRSGHRRSNSLVLASPGVHVPQIPLAERRNLSTTAKGMWRDLWCSPAASAWNAEADGPALLRYLIALDTWLAWQLIVKQAPLIRGSKEQLRPNPLITQMRVLERELRATEEAFGMSPRARISLGVSLAHGLSLLHSDEDEEPDYVPAGYPEPDD
jgi:P27 family predicted phage terminase small subunit